MSYFERCLYTKLVLNFAYNILIKLCYILLLNVVVIVINEIL